MTPEAVLGRAMTEWFTRIQDPAVGAHAPDDERGRTAIERYIREGLGSALSHGYAGDGSFSWCGAFAAWCWRAAGITVKSASPFAGADVPGHPFGSTYRLSAACKKDPAFRVAKISDIGPSDIVVVYSKKNPTYGDHIVSALAWGDKVQSELIAVHGNGHGRWPTGEWVEGVVVSAFQRSEIVAAYRPNERWVQKG